MNYISALLSVLKDLFLFVIKGDIWPIEVNIGAAALSLPPAVGKVSPWIAAPPLPLQIRSFSPAREGAILNTQTEAYVTLVDAAVYNRPLLSFDSVVTRLPYAARVIAARHEGRFTYIHYPGGSGWVHKDALVFARGVVFPEFVSGVVYDSYHDDTIRIRRLLKDEFTAAELFLPLQSVEYVTYQLGLNKRSLVWGNERPRPAGQWHTLLRGHREIHSGIAPQTGAIMEYITEAGNGYVAYTEVVRPDGTVVVSGVGKNIEGQFLREELASAIYLEWRPVWLEIGK